MSTTTTGPGRGSRPKHLPGDRFGELVILERLGAVNGSYYAWCRCICGTDGHYGLRHLVSGATVRCSNRDSHPDPRLSEAPAYGTAHIRVSKARGKASEHECPCGEPAEQWAFRHGTQSPLRMAEGRNAGSPYSPDPEQYWALCQVHHTAWDKAEKRVTEGCGDLPSLVHVAYWTATRSPPETF